MTQPRIIFSKPHLKFDTGSYTGDGTTLQGITGIGFRPQYVKVWESNGTDTVIVDIWETVDVILDDNVAFMSVSYGPAGADANRVYHSGIISQDADGFSVDDAGSDRHPNTNNQVYNYMVIG
jgi:hypothetical protein